MWRTLIATSTAARRVSLGFLALTLLAAGCTSASNPSSAGATPITVAVVPSPANAPLIIAVKDGLFRDHGLRVTVKNYNSASAELSALGNGKVDLAAGDYADFLHAQAVGQAKLHLIADGYDAAPGVMEIVTVPGTHVNTPASLVGKTVATPEPQGITYSRNVPYSMETLAAQAVLQSDGVSPSSVTWRPMPAKNMINALHSGAVSALLATQPQVLQAQTQLGATEVLDACSGVTSGIPLAGYFSLASYAHAHTSVIDGFKAAMVKAQSDASMRGPVQAVLTSSAGISRQDAALLTLGVYPTFLSVGQVQRVATLMYNSGMIYNSLNVASLVSG
jgi:NitT/TauT family transport system substrate-binding protein